MFFAFRTFQGMKEARITLVGGGLVSSMTVTGRGEARLRFGSTPLCGVYSGDTQLTTYPVNIELPTPGVLTIQVSGEAIAEVTFKVQAPPVVQILYDLDRAPPITPQEARVRLRRRIEQGPSAAERAPGINPRKEPVSVGMGYTDDELDALLVDAQRV